MTRRLLLVCLPSLWAAPAAAQAVLAGTVREDGTGRPLPGVQVLLEGSKRQGESGADGKYLLGDLPAGARVVLFRAVGFRPLRVRVTLLKGDTTVSDALMVREGVRLDSIVVTGTQPRPRGVGSREGFEERRALGFGRFMDSTEIRRADNARMSDLLSRLGVYMVNYTEQTGGANFRGPPQLRAANSRFASIENGEQPCWMGVMLDGITIYKGMTSGAESAFPPPDFRKEFPAATIERIEVYRSASEVPIEFGGSGARCGMIVLWTRRG